MPAFIDSLNRAFGGAFQALHSAMLQAIGMYVFRPNPVRLESQIYNEAAASMCGARLGDQKVVHSKCAQACSISYMPVRPW